MQQLSGLDNAFLLMEAGGQLGHVASLVVSTPSFPYGFEGQMYVGIFRQLVVSGSPVTPRLALKLV